MLRLAFYSLVLVLLKVLIVFAGQNKPSNVSEETPILFEAEAKQNVSTWNETLSKSLTANVTEAISTYKKNQSMIYGEQSFNKTIIHNETSQVPSMESKGRSLKNLSPGEEYLLSVTSWEDVADSSWESLPYLKTLIKKGSFDFDEDIDSDKKKESTPE
ncbi:hypothetical protein TNCT_160871, partial [Trichonephila clavata]